MGVEVREAAERFARTWESGWAHQNVDGIAELYAADCVHRSMPFRPPHVGRTAVVDYIRWSFADEPAMEVRFSAPIVDGYRAVMEYRVRAVEAATERPLTLAGCAFLRFNVEGLVTEVRDYWHVTEGHHELSGAPFL
jgi:hypothetical protein